MGFVFVALGGAVGAMGRYAISLIPVRTGFPVLTLLTNVLGAVFIGLIAGLVSGRDSVSPHAVLFWETPSRWRPIPCWSSAPAGRADCTSP